MARTRRRRTGNSLKYSSRMKRRGGALQGFSESGPFNNPSRQPSLLLVPKRIPRYNRTDQLKQPTEVLSTSQYLNNLDSVIERVYPGINEVDSITVAGDETAKSRALLNNRIVTQILNRASRILQIHRPQKPVLFNSYHQVLKAYLTASEYKGVNVPFQTKLNFIKKLATLVEATTMLDQQTQSRDIYDNHLEPFLQKSMYYQYKTQLQSERNRVDPYKQFGVAQGLPDKRYFMDIYGNLKRASIGAANNITYY